MISEILIVSVLLILLLYYFTQRRPPNFPPGPIGIPILGSLPFLGLPPEKGLAELAKKYGPVFSVFFANYPVVILTGFSAIKEAFKDDRFAGRPPMKILRERSWGAQRGIIFATGDKWMEQRRFTLRNLRDFGFGKGTMDTLIQDEIVELTNSLKKDLNHPVSIVGRFNASVLNSLWHITAGERYGLDDPKLKKIIVVLLDAFEKLDLKGPLFFMPWFTTLFPSLSGWNNVIGSLVPIYEFLKGHVDDHKKNFDADNPKDLIGVILKEIGSTTDPNSSFYKDEGEKNLMVVLLDLFAAGTDTTSTSLSWAILYLITYPEIQPKLQSEVDRVVGTNRLPSLSDRPRMPYMEAFLAESMRMSSIAPLGVFHSTTEDVTFRGYTIPKDTIVMANLWQLHHDKDYWGDPEVFRPERFITHSGSFKSEENLNPFSTGKRVCLGESLARDGLFLFTTGLVQQFNFEMDKSKPPPSLVAPIGILAKPSPYNVIIRERHGAQSKH